MNLLWLSDIHLNFLPAPVREDFYNRLKEKEPDAIIISGDIAESDSIIPMIKRMEQVVEKPVYFVCGNHDYYGAGIEQMRKKLKNLNWLPKNSGVPLTEDTILIGADGWGDCRNGDYKHSSLTMSDWLYIDELRSGYGKGMEKLKEVLQFWADLDAKKLKTKVLKAVKKYKKIIIVTHVPPFEEVCLYAGKKSTSSGLPFFSSKILGDSILPIALDNPEVKFIWLSGHTHARAEWSPCKNMLVKVAKADYCFPRVEETLVVED